MAEIMRGAPVAAAITGQLKHRSAALRERGIEPRLVILRVGERPNDMSYERGTVRRCEEVGIRAERIVLPADCSQADLMAVIERINADGGIHGCLMLRPLPEHLDERAICEALNFSKDVDSMTTASLDAVFTGRGMGFSPCTAQAVIELLEHYGYHPEGKNAAVIGRSLVIGRPVSMLLQSCNATVTMCHSRTENLAAVCRSAEILVVAAGKAGIVDESCTNPGQVIVDVGINAGPDGVIRGDVQFDRVEPLVRAISPVPGGVGAVTTAVLCKHVIEAAERAGE